jgi:hypothetical protein
MVNTNYHDEGVPDPGGDRDQWGDILNDLLRYYDGQIERRGAKSERPAAGNVPVGAKYVVDEGDDEGAVYLEDAGSWVKLPVNIVVYSDDSNAPAETVYFDSTDERLEYKDGGGTIHSGSGSFSGDPSDLNQDGATDGQHIEWDGSAGEWTAADPPGGALGDIEAGHTTEATVGLEAAETYDNYVVVGPNEQYHYDRVEMGFVDDRTKTDSDVVLRLFDESDSKINTFAISDNPNVVTEPFDGTNDVGNGTTGNQYFYWRLENLGTTDYVSNDVNDNGEPEGVWYRVYYTVESQ